MAGEERKSKKRKLSSDTKPNRQAAPKSEGKLTEARVAEYEAKILESPKHYNHIPTLLSGAKTFSKNPDVSLVCTLSLCRIFCKLSALGQLSKNPATEPEKVLQTWLKARYEEYVGVLLDGLAGDEEEVQESVMTMLALLLKQAGSKEATAKDAVQLLARILQVIVDSENSSGRIELAEELLFRYHDLRFHSFSAIRNLGSAPQKLSQNSVGNCIAILNCFDVADAAVDSELFYLSASETNKEILADSAHKQRAQEAWLAVLKNDLSNAQLRSILSSISTKIAPWFAQPERLMDFLTDAFDAGDSISLLALSGLWYLIRTKNLDYPSFYTKLYSLLDDQVLHSKNRSQFLRLMNTFLGSTHLPGAIVASFIKRLARLSLTAPPGAIVFVVPWIYNMLQRHPTCTFMIHREVTDAAQLDNIRDNGLVDPFDITETNPMETGAIDSSLWEIVSLQSHYHPNVASIAKILSDSFTKPGYQLDDFLGIGYNTLIDDELKRKKMKKPPVIEYKIPKRIFTKKETPDEPGEDSLLLSLWSFT